MGSGGSGPAGSEGWFPDPVGRNQYRWFDGVNWTDHVSSNGVNSEDPIDTPGKIPSGGLSDHRLQRGLAKAGVTPGSTQGGGSLFTEPVLVVNQKAKLIEVNNEYAISDQHGRQIGAVREVGQSKAKKVMRVLTSFDQYMTHHLQVVDASGVVQMQLTRPAKVVKSKVIVQDANGTEIGTIVQENVFGKIRFGMFEGSTKIGAIKAENWRAWNFSIVDSAEVEVARITKTFVGLAKAMFTSADNYVVQIHRPLQGALLTMVVAASVTVDTALKQDT